MTMLKVAGGREAELDEMNVCFVTRLNQNQ